MESYIGSKGPNSGAIQEFGLDGAAAKRVKAGYVFGMDNAAVYLQKSRADRETILFAHLVKENLHNAGFSETDRFVVTSRGLPYYESGGELYTATIHKNGAEARFDEQASVCAVSRAAGRLHKLTTQPGFLAGSERFSRIHKEHAAFFTPDGFDKQLRIMRGYKKTLQKQSRLSDFDVLFLRYFEGYEKRMSRCVELAYSDEVYNTLLSGVFCHNLLKEETVLFLSGVKNSEIFISCFDECSSGHYLFDLASIIRRHIKAASATGAFTLDGILNAYNQQNPLGQSSVKTLYAILLYPDKFYKTCVNYYSKKRTWTPASFITVLEDVTARADEEHRLISGYFETLIGR